MNFGKKIQNLRKREGLTQEELAEKIGVTRQTISKWELGETSPDLNLLDKISKCFGISLDELASSGTTKNSNVNVASYIGLFFTDLFAFMFMVIMFLLLVTVILFGVSALFVSICLAFNISVSNIIPAMPLVSKLPASIMLILLSILSFLGFIYLKKVVFMLVKMYLNYRSRVLSKTTLKEKFVVEVSSKLKKSFLIVSTLFVVFLVLTILISIIKSGTLDFWHEWKWFV